MEKKKKKIVHLLSFSSTLFFEFCVTQGVLYGGTKECEDGCVPKKNR